MLAASSKSQLCFHWPHFIGVVLSQLPPTHNLWKYFGSLLKFFFDCRFQSELLDANGGERVRRQRNLREDVMIDDQIRRMVGVVVFPKHRSYGTCAGVRGRRHLSFRTKLPVRNVGREARIRGHSEHEGLKAIHLNPNAEWVCMAADRDVILECQHRGQDAPRVSLAIC
jgi:hypothetical protein